MTQLSKRCLSWRILRSAFAAGFLAVLLLFQGTTFADDRPTAKWKREPVDGTWDNPANWSPMTFPNGDNFTAEFRTSTITNISPVYPLGAMIFDPGASAYTFTGDGTFYHVGIINNSGVKQTFIGSYSFEGASTAGSLTEFHGGASFTDGSSAGEASFTAEAGTAPGEVGDTVSLFRQRCTAGNATFTANGASVKGAGGGVIRIKAASVNTASFIANGGAAFGADGGHIVIIKPRGVVNSGSFAVNGGAVFGGRGGELVFHNASAGSSTLVANGGAGPGSGGSILFLGNYLTRGGTCRVELFGNGHLDVSRPAPAADSVGSIEGDGLVFLGGSTLTVGANNLSTTFSGVVSDSGGIHEATGGLLAKAGTGTLTLSGVNTYTGGTTVDAGVLLVDNTIGSGTGSGAVTIRAGTLGGTGTIAGPVAVDDGKGAGAILSPGNESDNIGTLTIQGPLAFLAHADYSCELDSNAVRADAVAANGVTINSGTKISITDLGTAALPVGTVFTVVDNTATAPIAGTFRNLVGGSTFTVGSNTYQADYEGADGNDLTFTVVP